MVDSHPFFTNSKEEQKEMLKEIGVQSIEDLFADLPKEVRLTRELNVPGPYAEEDLLMEFKEILKKNLTTREAVNLIGGGVYDYPIPAVVDVALSRGELYTAYTPYQPETSQGMLQLLFEYQSLVAELLGVEVVNASMYDWATAAGEALLMASRLTRRKKVAVASSISPLRLEVIKTYIEGPKLELVQIDYDKKTGKLNLDALKQLNLKEYAAVYIENPNFFGIIEDDVEEIGNIIHEHGALFIVGVDMLSTAILEAPGNYDADIIVGDGQGIGNYPNFGGPLLGIMALKYDKKRIRQLPGRLVGVAREKGTGRIGFAIVLSTREQHIKRERATSNICSNEALTAVAAAVYLSTVGPEGFKQRAINATSYAHYLADRIKQLEGFDLYFSGEFFREVTIKLPYAAEVLVNAAAKEGFLLSDLVTKVTGDPNTITLAADQILRKEKIDRFIEFLEKWRP